jgi:hypothetical protein
MLLFMETAKREGSSEAVRDFVDVAERLIREEMPQDFRERLQVLETSAIREKDSVVKDNLFILISAAVDNWAYLCALKRRDNETAQIFKQDYEQRKATLSRFVQDYRKSA